MDKKQIELMVCPECQSKLSYDTGTKELLCDKCDLAFPVKDGIPVMLVEQARKVESDKAK